MSLNELFLTFIVFVLVLKPNQSKQTIKKLKKFYKTIYSYKNNIKQTINNKFFKKVNFVDNLKKTNIFVENDITTNKVCFPIKINKNKHKIQKHKKFSTQSTKQTN